jgi:hypothetical protein
MAAATPPSGLLTTVEAGEYLRLPARTLEFYRGCGRGPAFLRIGRHIFYRRPELDLWLESCRVDPCER